MNQLELEARFQTREVTPGQKQRMDMVRKAFIEAATTMDSLVHDSRNKSIALTHLEEGCRAAITAISEE